MRDQHFDEEFFRAFNEASKQWSWASWHQIGAAQEQTARRLLEQVFAPEGEFPANDDMRDEAD